MMQEKKKFRPLTSNIVFLIYEILYKRGFLPLPLTKDGRQKVDALVASVNGVYFGQQQYSSSEERAVAYLYFIIKDHPFVDGNKRTACLSFEVFCEMNDLHPKYENFKLDELAVFLEKIKEKDHQKVIRKISNVLFF